MVCSTLVASLPTVHVWRQQQPVKYMEKFEKESQAGFQPFDVNKLVFSWACGPCGQIGVISLLSSRRVISRLLLFSEKHKECWKKLRKSSSRFKRKRSSFYFNFYINCTLNLHPFCFHVLPVQVRVFSNNSASSHSPKICTSFIRIEG